MVRIQQDITLAEAMDRILVENYAAVPPTDYNKQLRIVIRDAAKQSNGFWTEMEYIIETEFSDYPTLGDIDQLLTTFTDRIEDCLSRYGIIERAKELVMVNKMAEGGAK